MLSFDLSGGRGNWKLRASAELDGGCVGLFGKSGSGKSSLLRMISGLLEPETGHITLSGKTLFDRKMKTHVPPYRRRMGIVFQDNHLFPHYSVKGNLRYGESRGAPSTAPFSFEHIVDLMKLGPLLHRTPMNLSGGERRRVALGRALLSAPELLLLDEPLTGLDETLKAEILAFLQRIRDELRVPMIYVSHDLGEILRLTHRLWILHEGRLIGSGDYGDLMQDAGVIRHLLPLGPLNVFEMEVEGHDVQAGCTTFVLPEADQGSQSGSGPLRMSGPLIDAVPGSLISIAVRPEDVALSPAPVDLISVRNQIVGRIRRHHEHRGRSIVEIDIGVPLLVEISTGSFDRLGLESRPEVCCLIKATALRVLGAHGYAID